MQSKNKSSAPSLFEVGQMLYYEGPVGGKRELDFPATYKFGFGRKLSRAEITHVTIPYNVPSFIVIDFEHDSYIVLEIKTTRIFRIYIPWIDNRFKLVM